MDATHSSISPRAELWLCLAQAFLPPRGEILPRALKVDLTYDLDNLATALGLDIPSAIDMARTALLQIDEELLLPTYSALFLVPPIPAKLNVGFYLDGTLLGPNTMTLVDIYYRHSLEQSPDMHDTPDHFATLLEFLALLFHKVDGAAPDQLESMLDDMEAVRGMLWNALPELVRRVTETEQERFLPAVYSTLLQVVMTVLRDEQNIFFCATEADEKKTARRYFSKRETAPDLVACKICGKPVATARELKVIVDRLLQSGLPADHLELCPDCRDGTQGWKAGNIVVDLPGLR